MELQSELNVEGLTEAIRCLTEENYDLGKLTRIKEVLGGYCHKSYALWIAVDNCIQRYFLRLYNPNVIETEILAHLHHCGHGFKKPPGADRVQPRIMEFIPTFKKKFCTFMEQAGDRRCDRLFKDNFGSICNALDVAASYNVRFQGMKEIPIHCDYHPGNLKFRGEKGVGIFDFDWSKVDYRLFDVALALVYFTSIWDDQVAGLRPDKFTLFIDAYNKACLRFSYISPLTKQERRHLIPMLSIANLYVLNWDLVDFYDTPNQNDDEYYSYINHNIGLVRWIALHVDKLKRWVNMS